MRLVRTRAEDTPTTNTIRVPHAVYERLRGLSEQSEVSVSKLAGELLERSLADMPAWIKLRTMEKEHLRSVDEGVN